VWNVEEQEASGLFTEPMKKVGFTQLRKVQLKMRRDRFDGDGDAHMGMKDANVAHVILKQVFGIQGGEHIIKRDVQCVTVCLTRRMNALQMFSGPGRAILFDERTGSVQLTAGERLAQLSEIVVGQERKTILDLRPPAVAWMRRVGQC
jgi:hypothetical protein